MDIGQIILWAGASCTALIVVARGLLELAKLTKTKRDDKILKDIIRFTSKVFEVISGIKNTLEINVKEKK